MSEPAELLVFVNEQPVRVAPGASAHAAVQACDAALAARLQADSAYLTDGRGIRLDPAAPVFSGAILRVVTSARATSQADADA